MARMVEKPATPMHERQLVKPQRYQRLDQMGAMHQGRTKRVPFNIIELVYEICCLLV